MFRSFPSSSTILLSIFFAYISYSLWTMIQLFIPPHCPIPKNCLRSIIEENPKFQFLAFSSIKKLPRYDSEVTLLHKEKMFDYEHTWEKKLSVELPLKVRSNGSMYLHLFLTAAKVNSQWMHVVNEPHSVYASVPLTQFQVPEAKSFNLLGENANESEGTKKIPVSSQKSKSKSQPVSHFASQVTFNVLTQSIPLPRDAIPYEIGRSLRLSPRGKYLPILHIDLLSMRVKDLVEITSSLSTANLTINYSPISFGKLRMWVQFEGAMDTMLNLGFTNKDIDEVKGIFSDSNLYLLCATFIVATLHLVFDFLAFKNDISFWRGLDSMGGISPTTVVWRTFAQIVIFLYLMEEDTSMLVLLPAGIGALIEIWKVTKAFHVEWVGWKPTVCPGGLTKEESSTKKLDSEGLRYLSYVLYPLCLGGAVYSLLYTPHKSWYSWVINSLVNGIYAFGFLFMLPQLFINYKLKSVAHLPWRAFMYKAFNTFIDDLFAFIITMPTAHRVACFRDDIVFLIYLYQRWLYPVDKTRINEFGQSGEDKPKKE